MGGIARFIVRNINRNQKLGITSVITLLIILSSLLTAYMLRLSEVKYKMNCIDPVMRKQEEKLTEWNAGLEDNKYIWEPGEPLYDYAYKTTEEFLKMNNGCKIGGSILNLTEDETVVFRVSIGFTIAISLYALLLLLSHFNLLGSSYETIRQFNRKEQRRFKQAIVRRDNREARSEYDYDNTALKVSQSPELQLQLFKKILNAFQANAHTRDPEINSFEQWLISRGKSRDDYNKENGTFNTQQLQDDFGEFIVFQQGVDKIARRRKNLSQAWTTTKRGAKLVGRGAQRGAQGLRGIFSKGQKEGRVTLNQLPSAAEIARDPSGGSEASRGSFDSLMSAESPGGPHNQPASQVYNQPYPSARPEAAPSDGVAGYTHMYAKEIAAAKRRQVQSTRQETGTDTGAGVMPGGAKAHAAATSDGAEGYSRMYTRKNSGAGVFDGESRPRGSDAASLIQKRWRGIKQGKFAADKIQLKPTSTGGGAGSSAQPVTTPGAMSGGAGSGGRPGPALSPKDREMLTLLKQKTATQPVTTPLANPVFPKLSVAELKEQRQRGLEQRGATKIQSVYRGRQDRDLAARKREEAAAAAEAAVKQNLTRARRDVRLQPLETDIPGTSPWASYSTLPPIQTGAQSEREKRPSSSRARDLHLAAQGGSFKHPRANESTLTKRLAGGNVSARAAPITGPPSPPGTPPSVGVAGPGSALTQTLTQTRTATDLLRARARAQATGTGNQRLRQEARSDRRLPGTMNVSESPRSTRASRARAAANRETVAAAQKGSQQQLVGSFDRSPRGAGGLSGSASAPQLSLAQRAARAGPMSPQMYDKTFMSV